MISESAAARSGEFHPRHEAFYHKANKKQRLFAKGDYPLSASSQSGCRMPPFHGVVSLLDMLKFSTRVLLSYSRAMGMAEISAKHVFNDQDTTVVNENQRSMLLSALNEMTEMCAAAELDSATDQIARVGALLQSSDATLRDVFRSLIELQNRIDDALNRRVFLVLHAKEGRLYDSEFPFGEQVATVFSKCSFDISEAAKSLACARATACVFHCMRIMEVGLHLIARKVRIQVNDDKNWQTILNEIDKALNALPSRTVAQKKKKQYLSGAASYLHHVKMAWRNPVMHVRGKYTPEEAENIWNAVRGFMQYLAGPIKVKARPGGVLGRIRSS